MNLEITYCGHSTVLIELSDKLDAKKTRLIIDPFLKGNPKCPENLKSVAALDYIFLTHGHSDHTADAVELAIQTGAIIFATFELCNLLAEDGVPQNQIQYMNKGGRVDLINSPNLKAVNLTDAAHSSSYTCKQGRTHYAGEACGIVMELSDGRNVYHAGDTSLFGDMSLIRERFKPELIFLPIGDRFTMGPHDAALATKILNPKFVIPIHFGTFDALSGTVEEFGKYLANVQSEAKLIAMEPGEKKLL